MPGWLKVMLVVVGITVAVVVALGIGGYVWLEKNRDRLRDLGRQAETEGRRYGAGHSASGCFDEAFRRLDRESGILAEAGHRIFFRACLDGTTRVPSLCEGVPEKREIVRSATWAVGCCSEGGRGGDQACARLFQAVQEHCHRQGPAGGGKAAPAPQ